MAALEAASRQHGPQVGKDRIRQAWPDISERLRQRWRRLTEDDVLFPGGSAAYLAGGAAGLCPDLDGFAAQWQRDKRFTPHMDAAMREMKYSGWKDAVRRTLTSG